MLNPTKSRWNNESDNDSMQTKTVHPFFDHLLIASEIVALDWAAREHHPDPFSSAHLDPFG
jgi:hypothetical protein